MQLADRARKLIVRRELELWRAEAQLLDYAGSHYIGREEKLARLNN